MKKTICIIFIEIVFCLTITAQSVTANQNQQIINVNVPTIEKKVYIERFRTVYVDKPRTPRKLDAPIQLLGYLWVYPEDIGNFSSVPVEVLLNINKNKPYGRNNWRMPTPDELAILENNADLIGLSDGIYLATDHRNGILRLVATDIDYSDFVLIGDTYWSICNFGTTKASERGRPLTYQEAVEKAPEGYRLPTEDEILNLIYSSDALIGNSHYHFSEGSKIELPFTESGDAYVGKYWIQGNKYIYFEFRWGTYYTGHYFATERRLVKTEPEIRSSAGESTTAHVKYVLDR